MFVQDECCADDILPSSSRLSQTRQKTSNFSSRDILGSTPLAVSPTTRMRFFLSMINSEIQSQLQMRDSDRFVDNILHPCLHHLCLENHTNSEGDCMGLRDAFRLLCS